MDYMACGKIQTEIQMNDKMFCPVCQEKNLKSSVYGGPTMQTLVNCMPYYDEDGNYHFHDRNISTSYYSCSLGHRWSVSNKAICPSCDYGHDSNKIVITCSDECNPESNINFTTIAGTNTLTIS